MMCGELRLTPEGWIDGFRSFGVEKLKLRDRPDDGAIGRKDGLVFDKSKAVAAGIFTFWRERQVAADPAEKTRRT